MSIITKHMNQVSEAMTLVDVEEIEKVVMALGVVKKNRGTVFICGNGGSHATASHFANDLMKMARVRAVCLGDMASAVSAYGNDNGWVNMFSDPLREIIKPPDGVVGISCSGNSENVLNALEMAMSEGAVSVGLTGISLDSKISKMDLHGIVHVVSEDIRVQEDLHLMVCHAIVRALQEIEI